MFTVNNDKKLEEKSNTEKLIEYIEIEKKDYIILLPAEETKQKILSNCSNENIIVILKEYLRKLIADSIKGG